MKKQSFICAKLLSLPVREVWIEIGKEGWDKGSESVTSREGSVDWNLPLLYKQGRVFASHFPWGKCGLKFWFTLLLIVLLQSLPVREVWIEITSAPEKEKSGQSLPVREVWIEIKALTVTANKQLVTSREGSVDWNREIKVKALMTTVTSREGSVDWNYPTMEVSAYPIVTSREGSLYISKNDICRCFPWNEWKV